MRDLPTDRAGGGFATGRTPAAYSYYPRSLSEPKRYGKFRFRYRSFKRIRACFSADRTTLLLHCGEGTLPLPAYAGRQELLTGQPFAGALGAYGVAVVEG